MFGFKRKKQLSVKDFSSPKARRLFEVYNISPQDVFPLYRDLEAEILAGSKEKGLDLSNPPEGMIKKLVCGAIISYELESKKEIKLFDEGKRVLVKRLKNPKVYGFIGNYYEHVAERLRGENQDV